MGRPSDFTQELADLICEELADGKSLRSICENPALPNRATVARWLSARPEFRDQYARARELQADALMDDILTIADDRSNDISVVGEEGKEREIVDHEVIQRSRLKVETRMKLAGKLAPKKYGDKLTLDAVVRLEDQPTEELIARLRSVEAALNLPALDLARLGLPKDD